MPGFEVRGGGCRRDALGQPFGQATSSGRLAGKDVAFLARHGRGHRISPSELNFRANIYAMKSLGVERIISLSAVGSLKEEHRPLDFVIPDQFFDRTRGRRLDLLRRRAGGAHQLRRIRSARNWPRRPPGLPRGGSEREDGAAPTCAWKVRRSPPWPNPTSTEAGAWTSSA